MSQLTLRIALGADHGAPDLKNAVAAHLIAAGHEVRDFGTHSTSSVDYADYANAVARAVADGSYDFGILACTSGVGMCIAANRHTHVRAANARSIEEAVVVRRHNDANILCLGANHTDPATAVAMADAFLATAALTLTAHTADSVIARAGDRDITVSQIQPYLSSLSEADRAALKENPTALSQAVRTLILQQVLLKEASNADWDDKPETQALLARVRDAAIAESYLESVTKLPADFPSDAEIKEVYDARKAELSLPKQYRLAQIFIANGTDPAKAKAKADALAKQVKSGDFAALAKTNSDEPRSAANGGEIGLLPEDSIQPAIRKALTGLAKGATAGPIELGDGLYFVKILDIQEPRTATLEEVKPQIIRALRTERQNLNRQAYLQRLQSQAPITLDEIALPALLKSEDKK